MNLLPTSPGSSWIVKIGPHAGTRFTWLRNEHCMVLVGYDKTHFFVNDPLQRTENVRGCYPKNLFTQRFNEMGTQSVVVDRLSLDASVPVKANYTYTLHEFTVNGALVKVSYKVTASATVELTEASQKSLISSTLNFSEKNFAPTRLNLAASLLCYTYSVENATSKDPALSLSKTIKENDVSTSFSVKLSKGTAQFLYKITFTCPKNAKLPADVKLVCTTTLEGNPLTTCLCYAYLYNCNYIAVPAIQPSILLPTKESLLHFFSNISTYFQQFLTDLVDAFKTVAKSPAFKIFLTILVAAGLVALTLFFPGTSLSAQVPAFAVLQAFVNSY